MAASSSTISTVSHLECSRTGKVYEAGQLWNLSEEGWPLLEFRRGRATLEDVFVELTQQ